jgi:penicillin-binding protein 2
MNLRDAITQSCDVFFYTLANSMGIDRIYEHLTRFGLGVQTGIDLENEPSGLVPSREWKRRNRDEPWYPGETVITGIGQGFLLATPLQLAMVAATLANRGERMKPSLLKSVVDTVSGTEQVREVELLDKISLSSEDYYDVVIGAMEAVVHGERGTARRSGLNAGYRFAGKTGTAQVIGIAQGERYDADEIEERFRDHAMFIAFAPVDNPRIAVAVIAENGGGGSTTAAPIARKVLDYYLLGADFVKFEPLQSPVLTGQL